MLTYSIKFDETDLASRQAAAALRALVEQHVQANERVFIDLETVLSISESYADELFGVLALRHGLDWLTEHLVIRHARPFVFKAIAAAIRQRLLAGKSGSSDIALLAARTALVHRQAGNN